MKKYLRFLILAYATAFIFESLANTLGDGTLFQSSSWPIFFLLWYGFIYSIAFFLLRKKPLWAPTVTGAIFGPALEIVFFNRLNIYIDPLIYAIMFFIPFWDLKRQRV